MKIIIDTHYLLWVLFDTTKLNETEKKILTDSENEIYISAVSIWEISLKFSIGKLELNNFSPSELVEIIEKTGFKLLDLTGQDASNFHLLPRVGNSDPFDRMLIWQAISGKYFFLSRDKNTKYFKNLGLKIL